MNTLNIVYLGIFSLLLVSPMACEDAKPELEESVQTLNLTPAEEKIVHQDNAFSLSLFREAAERMDPSENVLLSPMSASIALAMLNNGANGETKEAINRALKFEGFTQEQINTYYQKLIKALPNLDPETTLQIANSVWYRNGFNVLPDFLNRNESFYHSEVQALDFTNAGAPERINDWVSKSTKGKISSIVDEIPADMMMYLINAIYFKGSWQEKFDASKTKKMPFNRNGASVLSTDFMNIEKEFNIVTNQELQGIELPYGNGQYSMFVMMPAQGTSAIEFAERLSHPDKLGEVYTAFSKRTTNLYFPKFKFSYQNKLNDELSKLGMDIAFTDQADFTGVAKEDLSIDEVKQKSFIEVNEEGTEAAAVTSVGVRVTSMPIVQTLKFDRPFVFLIRENNCGLILFTGIINDPSKEENGD